jgi:hypothetical protein
MANEFGTGFSQGLNYYTKFAEMQQNKLLDEERLKTERLRQESYQFELEEKKSTQDVRMEGIQSETDFRTARAEKTRVETDEFIAQANNRKQNAELLLETNKNNLEITDLKLTEQAIKTDDVVRARAFKNLMNAYAIAGDTSIDIDVRASMVEDALTQVRPYIDWTKYLDDSYWQGWEKITPQLESGDFEGIARDHSDVLSVIYKDSLDKFKGKDFVAKDGRKGVIQGVKLSGDFNPIAESANSLVGGTYSVLFEGQTEPEDVFTFMPDKAQYAKTIKEDQEGSDAKVVSIADMVDKVAAEKDFAMYLLQSPETFNSLMKASKGSISLTGSPAEKKDKVEIYNSEKDKRTKFLGDSFKQASEFAEDYYKNPESAYLQSLYNSLPAKITTSNIQKTTDEDGEEVYEYKDGKNADTLTAEYHKEYLTPEKLSGEIENAYAAFEKLEKRLPGQKAIYSFGPVSMSFDKTKSYVDAVLEDSYGADVYNKYKQDASILYERSYNGRSLEDATDAEYLAFMEAFIERKSTIGN